MRTLLMMLLAFAPAPSQGAPTLASLKDKNRVLLVFTPSEQSPNFQRQFNMLAKHASDLRERDLIVLPVLTPSDHPTNANSWRAGHPPIASATEQVDLRHRFHVAPDQFTVILIGKDGGEKLRQHAPITLEKLNATIDAMPMRQEEMRRGR